MTMLLAVFFESTATFMPLGSLERTTRLSMFAIVGSNDSPRTTATLLV